MGGRIGRRPLGLTNMILSHYQMMAALDAAQMKGAWAAPIHAQVRQAFRKANMKGAQITTLDALKAYLPAYAFAKVVEGWARVYGT